MFCDLSHLHASGQNVGEALWRILVALVGGANFCENPVKSLVQCLLSPASRDRRRSLMDFYGNGSDGGSCAKESNTWCWGESPAELCWLSFRRECCSRPISCYRERA